MNLLQGVRTVKRGSGARLLLWSWLLLLGCAVNSVSGQVDNVYIYGTVKDLTSAKKLDDVTVTVFKNGAKLIDVPTNASGKYEINLDYGADYKIVVAKSGFVGKNIKIDTRNIPEEDRQGGHGMNIDFSMLTDLPGIDYSVLNEPFGLAAYNGGEFNWDLEYTNRMRDAQARLMKEYDDMRKREGDSAAKYEKLMENGEKAMGDSDFKKAVESFTEALTLKPKDAIATAKLSDAQMRLTSQEAEKKANEKYDAVIKEADGLFNKKDYAGAKTKFLEASDLRTAETYPKQKVTEINSILADLERLAEEEKKAKELQAKYEAAITAADAALKAETWDQAIAKYTEASGFKPEEKYPKDQLALVATKKAEAAAKAEAEKAAKKLEEDYKAAVAAADAAFKTSDWATATTKYTEASGLKPDEKYPKDQLAAIDAKKEEQAKKAEEEKLAKELQANYEAAIASADAFFKAADYDAAENKYNEALGLKKDEKYPKDQLVAIGKKREELAAKAAEEEKAKELEGRYQALIASADVAFSTDDWKAATDDYTAASALKPAEKYPKDKLAEITKKIADAEKKAEAEKLAREQDERYQAAIAKADKAFEKSEWESARSGYTEAQGVKPEETYPAQQLEAITARIAQAEADRKKAELDAKYDAAIAEADAAFDKKDLAKAKTSYQAASALKTEESYPKGRISEIDALVAEEARLAEEARKAAEQEKRYTDLIASADKAFDGKKWSQALNDYKDASGLKPSEAYPKERISSIEAQMDAAAQAKAEEERLLREQQEKDKRYADLITSADKAFAAKTYDKARTDYQAALGVKPEEEHPKDRITEIEGLLAALAQQDEEAKAKAARDAEEQARKAEADRLAADAAAAEKARLAELERQKKMASEQIDTEYRELVAAGDIAFGQDDLDGARQQYTSALGVKPGEQYPKDKIAAIDAELAKRASKQSEEERLAAARQKAEQDRLAREAAEAEAARAAEIAAQEKADAERAKREAEEAAKRAAMERERMALNGAKELEERYRASVIRADEALAAKEYMEARSIYGEASDIKPDETYPLAKIDQIDKLLAEQERLRAEAELAAQQVEQPKEVERAVSTVNGSGQEDEAVRFMREAKEREDAEKYERIRKFRSDLDAEEAQNTSEAAVRRGTTVEQKERIMEESAQLYMGNDQRRLQKAEELDAYRVALERAEAERRQRSREARTQNYQGKLDLVEQVQEQDRTWDDRQEERVRGSKEEKEALAEADSRVAAGGRERTEAARAELDAVAQGMDDLQARGNGLTAEKRTGIETEKRALDAREASYGQRSADSRAAAKGQLDETAARTGGFADQKRSQLAQEYPQGVTEESYTEGNKVIIRRVVVSGNKADEYSKVIAKWGTFYFKNGQSISETIWSSETEG